MSNFASTQKYLKISEIKNDCLVLKDGSLRVILLASSINFALKSEDEQKAVIQNYARFLNTLEFPLQIVTHSRPFNIDPYVNELNILRQNQTNELLRNQTTDYRDFIKELIDLGQIMSRRFYIVVPYNPGGDTKKGFFSRGVDTLSAAIVVKIKKEKFETYREALFKRADNITAGLSSMGVKARPLDTQSLIELFYKIYNPTESKNQNLVDLKKLRIEEE
ncbi:TraC family protein [Patescibacteria group bacterium]|nr:TraC family protein [Patescibacteria group bacterium]